MFPKTPTLSFLCLSRYTAAFDAVVVLMKINVPNNSQYRNHCNIQVMRMIPPICRGSHEFWGEIWLEIWNKCANDLHSAVFSIGILRGEFLIK